MNEMLMEAKKLIDIINFDKVISKKEKIFIKAIENYIDLKEPPTIKQIYWLRDIKDRQLDKD
jgi:hypothetical protein